MEYICHKPFRRKGALGNKFFIKKGKTFNTIGDFIVSQDNKPICAVTSRVAYQHFARNDDHQGIQRGDLTYKIAFLERQPDEKIGFRFTPEERELLQTEYPQFLKQDCQYLVFNYDFFNANIDQLQELYDKLERK